MTLPQRTRRRRNVSVWFSVFRSIFISISIVSGELSLIDYPNSENSSLNCQQNSLLTNRHHQTNDSIYDMWPWSMWIRTKNKLCRHQNVLDRRYYLRVHHSARLHQSNLRAPLCVHNSAEPKVFRHPYISYFVDNDEIVDSLQKMNQKVLEFAKQFPERIFMYFLQHQPPSDLQQWLDEHQPD